MAAAAREPKEDGGVEPMTAGDFVSRALREDSRLAAMARAVCAAGEFIDNRGQTRRRPCARARFYVARMLEDATGRYRVRSAAPELATSEESWLSVNSVGAPDMLEPLYRSGDGFWQISASNAVGLVSPVNMPDRQLWALHRVQLARDISILTARKEHHGAVGRIACIPYTDLTHALAALDAP